MTSPSILMLFLLHTTYQTWTIFGYPKKSMIRSVRRNTLQMRNYALSTRISKQLNYPFPHLSGLFLHLCSFFFSWTINLKSVLFHLGKRNGLQLFQIFRYLPATVFIATGMLQTYGLKPPKTQQSQSSSLLLESVFLPHFNSLFSYD